MDQKILVATGATLIAYAVYAAILCANESIRTRARILVTMIWLSMITAWPACWRVIVGPYANTKYAPIGLVWPIVIMTLDLVAMQQHTYESQRQPKRQFMTMDANALCSLSFGIAAFLGVQRDHNISRIFLWAIVACVAFIMPTPHTDGTSLYTVGVDAFQKGIMAYAVGLLISGIILIHNSSSLTAPSTPS